MMKKRTAALLTAAQVSGKIYSEQYGDPENFGQ